MRWESEGNAWRVVVSHTGGRHSIRTVTIFKRHPHTLRYQSISPREDRRIPQTVLNKYDEFISLGRDVR